MRVAFSSVALIGINDFVSYVVLKEFDWRNSGMATGKEPDLPFAGGFRCCCPAGCLLWCLPCKYGLRRYG